MPNCKQVSHSRCPPEVLQPLAACCSLQLDRPNTQAVQLHAPSKTAAHWHIQQLRHDRERVLVGRTSTASAASHVGSTNLSTRMNWNVCSTERCLLPP